MRAIFKDASKVGAAVAGFIVGFVVATTFASMLVINGHRADAVKSGHAEWAASDSGSPVFKWKEPQG